MQNNIQTIIDKFDKKLKLKDSVKSIKREEYEDIILLASSILKDSLTSMLDDMEKELPEKQGDDSLITDYFQGYEDGANQYRQEVINIINSHR